MLIPVLVVQVVRYTALFSGIAYGWYHRRTLQATHDAHKREEAVHHREKLIAEAKDAWKRKQEALSDTNRACPLLVAFRLAVLPYYETDGNP